MHGDLLPVFHNTKDDAVKEDGQGHLVAFMMESVYLVSVVISWEPKQFRYRIIFMDMLKRALYNNETTELPLFGSDLITSKIMFSTRK